MNEDDKSLSLILVPELPSKYETFQFPTLNGTGQLSSFAMADGDPNMLFQLFEYSFLPNGYEMSSCRSHIVGKFIIKNSNSLIVAVRLSLPFFLIPIVDSINQDEPLHLAECISLFCTKNQLSPACRLLINNFSHSPDAFTYLAKMADFENSMLIKRKELKMNSFISDIAGLVRGIISKHPNSMNPFALLSEWIPSKYHHLL